MSNNYNAEMLGSIKAGLNYDFTRVSHRANQAVYIRPAANTSTPASLNLADAKELHAHLGKLIDQIEAGIEAQKPKLPTAFGSVVQVGGVKYVLDHNWYRDGNGFDRVVQPGEMAVLDYTVLRDGI